MNNLEKTLQLKAVPLFAEIPDELLQKLVESSVKEDQVKMGDLIFQKGEIGRDMFIIINGRVRVHENNFLIKELGEGEIFGELAALSFNRRVASVSALTNGLLLKISSSGLYELMNQDQSLAKGIIKALCERMESMAMQVRKDKK